ncbi:MAG: ABC transporter ATP-binding protein/permease [Lentisphaeria bacterium]|nr:ABC transporter ATP-binding protein/permease [Lentisphaeria bacterium]
MMNLMSCPFHKTVKTIWGLCADKRLAAYSLGAALHSLLTMAVPFFLGLFIDSLITGENPRRFFLISAGVALLAWGMDLFLRNMIIRIARTRELQLQYRLLESFQSMKPAAVDAYANGEIAMKFYRDTGNIEQFIAGFYPQFLNMFFGFVWALLIVLYKKPSVVVLYLFFLPALFACSGFYVKKLAAAAHAIRFMYDHSINRIFEIMRIFPYLKSMAADEPYFSAPKAMFRTYRRVNTINDKTMMMFEFINRFFLIAGEYSVLGFAGWMAWKKKIPVGDVVMFQILFLSVLNSFSGMFQMLPNWKTARESMDSVCELLNTPDTEDVDSNQPVPSAFADISVKNLSFQYTGTKPVFHDFSCEIKAGTIVALTGINGSGKTTLLKLLTGYLTPSSGHVAIGGNPLCSCQQKSFRQKISYVFQDSLLISGTLKDNITLKNIRYTEADIFEALLLSGADELVSRVPGGLNYKVGQNGDGLSGGERQKIAVARALIRKPEILVFDEVTNHLDYQSRTRVRDLILSFRGKVTVFMVSHDPELVKLCDQEINLAL